MKINKIVLFLLLLLGLQLTSFAQLAVVGVTDVNPESGYVGQTVAIRATNVPLFGTKVFFGDYEARCLPLQLLNLGGSIGLTPATYCIVPSGPPPGSEVRVKIQNIITLQVGQSAEFTYNELPPAVTSLSPTSGYVGTTVQVTTTKRPENNTKVMFSTIEAACSPFAKNQSLYTATCTAPAGLSGAVDVALSADGARGGVQVYTYLSDAPAVTALSPSSGYSGTVVNITVPVMPQAGTTVLFSSHTASCSAFSANGANFIASCAAPSGVATGAASVYLSSGGVSGLSQVFTYLATPAVTGLLPASGYPGASVVVTAAAAVPAGSTVMFGNVAATCSAFTFSGVNYEATCTVPSGPTGNANVIIKYDGQDGVGVTFAYLPPPAVTLVTPLTGYAGTQVIITTAIAPQDGTTVTFGGVLATCSAFAANGSVFSATCTAPSGPVAGAQDVLLTKDGQNGVPGVFTYLAPATPQAVSGLNPTSGYTGQTVVVSTTVDPTADTKVFFGANEASCLAFLPAGPSAFNAECIVPTGTTGSSVDVTLKNSAGTGTGISFTYTASPIPPALTLLSPTSGYAGDTVTVTAAGILPDGTTVMFGTTQATCTSFTLVSSVYEGSCTVPQGPALGSTVSVTLQNPAGTSTGVNFTYSNLPSITALSPTNGYAGESVTVTSSGALPNNTTVMFGTNVASCSAFSGSGSNYSATCTVPQGPALGSTLSVTLKNASGNGSGQDFTYSNLPDVTALSVTSGLAGDSVLITTNGRLPSDAGVVFGTYAATCNTFSGSASNYSATCTVPLGPESGSGVDVKVQNPNGNGTAISFNYTGTVISLAPTITSLNPATGWGGTVVTIAGTNLTGATVTFGTRTAQCNGISATQLTCTAPASVAGSVSVVAATNDGFSDGSIMFNYDLNDAPLPVAPDINATVTHGGMLTLNLSDGTTNGPIVSANIVQSITPAEGTLALNQLVMTFTPADTYDGPLVLNYTVTNALTKVSNQGTITISIVDRPDPTKDESVREMLSAQLTSVKRYIKTQMSNFNTRLTKIRGKSELDNDVNIALGIKESQNRDLYAYGEDVVGSLFAQNGQSDPVRSVEITDVMSAFTQEPTEPVAKKKKDYGVWVGGSVDVGSEKEVTDLDYTTVALSGGIDKVFSKNLTAGIGIGYTRDKTDLHGGSDLTGGAYTAALYSSYAVGNNIYLEGLLGYSYVRMDADRATLNGKASGTRNANQVFGSVGAAYEYQRNAWRLSPFTRLEAAWTGLNSYSESGAGDLNLKYADGDVQMLALALGADTSYEFKMNWGALTPKVGVEYLHNFDQNSRLDIGYADTDSTPYSFSGQAFSRDNISLDVSLDVNLNSEWAFFCGYKITKGDNVLNNSVAVQGRYSF